MTTDQYQPQPLETAGVRLPPALEQLQEMLARNGHEVWARERLAHGWTLGPRRDDARKEHPCLVPYEQLPDAEKEYDRKLTQSTLATIVALGYRIEPPATSHAETGDAPVTATDLLAAALAQLQSRVDLDLTALLSIWHGRVAEQWQGAPHAYQLLAQRLLGLGEPLLAYDVTSEGLRCWSTDTRLRQLEALALARSGATVRANRMLRELHAGGATDEETVGILARTEKDFALAATDPRSRLHHLGQAADLYAESFQRHGGYWSGINAATLFLLRDQAERAAALARTVHEQCLAIVTVPEHAADYWPLATLGEAALIVANRAEAAQWYARAAVEGRRRLGDMASTHRNAGLLLDHLGGDRQAVDQALRMPAVALAMGSGSNDRDAVHAWLAGHDCLVGYSSLANPADLVFIESLIERGGSAYVVVPYDVDRYMQDMAWLADDPSSAERAENALRRVAQVIVASPHGGPSSGTDDEFANLLLHGLALSRARHLDTNLVPIPTATYRRALDVEAPEPVAPAYPTQIVAMLFADAVHFSRLGEAEVVRFTAHFMSSIGQLLAESPYAPEFTNTWGDGLFFVFRSVRNAGLFAIALCDLINATDWVALGLPAELNLRIGLHAGPVFSYTDPITGRPGYFGTHISRAARIEPITPPGQVYASEAFAALAELDSAAHTFTCEYVGQTPQAKGYGTFPTYHLRAT